VAANFFPVFPKLVAQRDFLRHFCTPDIIATSIPACLSQCFANGISLGQSDKNCPPTLLLKTCFLYDYFPNFIAQLCSLPRRKKIANGKPTLHCNGNQAASSLPHSIKEPISKVKSSRICNQYLQNILWKFSGKERQQDVELSSYTAKAL
jgi:hypothetical protein